MYTTIGIVSLVLMILFVMYIPIPFFIRNVLRKRFIARVKQKRGITLTFDDGPGLDSTPRILGALEKAGVKAVFFITGKNAQRYPHIVQQICDGGHEVGSHGYAHVHPWKSLPLRSLADLVKGEQVVKAAMPGDRPACFLRPPYGKLNLVTLLYVVIFRKKLAFWDIDPRDYEKSSPGAIVEEAGKGMEEGAVVLLHDSREHDGESADATVMSVDEIIKAAKERKLALYGLGERLAA